MKKLKKEICKLMEVQEEVILVHIFGDLRDHVVDRVVLAQSQQEISPQAHS